MEHKQQKLYRCKVNKEILNLLGFEVNLLQQSGANVEILDCIYVNYY